MNTKVYMVTGVTSSLGKAIALELAKTGEMVVMVAQDTERGAQVEKEISAATQNPNLDLQLCDFSNISSVRNLATIVLSRYDNIHLLINNAAIYHGFRETSVDGFERMFAGNYLGTFLLTYLLQDRLRAGGSARVINMVAPSTVELNFDDLQHENHFNPVEAFGATQMANLLFTFELARRLENTGVRVNAFRPGLVRTSLKESFSPIRLLTWLFASPAEQVAQKIVRAATAPEFENTTGKLFYKGNEVQPPIYALDRAVQQRLWEVSESLTKAPEQGPNYDPTGSIAMYDKDRDEIPEALREDGPEI